MSALDDRLLNAHAAGDIRALAALYEQAADAQTETEAAAFFLTHAYVHALEAGLPAAARLRQRLIDMGREVPQQ